MADSQPLLSLDWDPVAAEGLLRDVFGIVVDEVIWKGTSATEKVGPFSLLFLLINLVQNLTLSTRLLPRLYYRLTVCLRDWVLGLTVLIYHCSCVALSAHWWCLVPTEMSFGQQSIECLRAPRISQFSSEVCEWKEPEELKQLLDLELQSQGESQEQILERCRAVIRYSVKTCGSWLLVGGVFGVCTQLHSELPAPFSRSPSLLQPALLRVGSSCSGRAHCH